MSQENTNTPASAIQGVDQLTLLMQMMQANAQLMQANQEQVANLAKEVAALKAGHPVHIAASDEASSSSSSSMPSVNIIFTVQTLKDAVAGNKLNPGMVFHMDPSISQHDFFSLMNEMNGLLGPDSKKSDPALFIKFNHTTRVCSVLEWRAKDKEAPSRRPSSRGPMRPKHTNAPIENASVALPAEPLSEFKGVKRHTTPTNARPVVSNESDARPKHAQNPSVQPNRPSSANRHRPASNGASGSVVEIPAGFMAKIVPIKQKK